MLTKAEAKGLIRERMLRPGMFALTKGEYGMMIVTIIDCTEDMAGVSHLLHCLFFAKRGTSGVDRALMAEALDDAWTDYVCQTALHRLCLC